MTARMVFEVFAPWMAQATNPNSALTMVWFDTGTICEVNEDSAFCLNLDTDTTRCFLQQEDLTCAGAPYNFGTYSFLAFVCGGFGVCGDPGPPPECGFWEEREDLEFRVSAEALGCVPPPPPPQGSCGCECKLGGASPGGGGGAAGGSGGDGPPGDGWGTGAHLRYHAGGAGHPGYPGSDEWRETLGLYWSHDYAIRIVPDPDETNVWLITEDAIFRNFSGLDAGGVYQTVSTSAEKRTLSWLNPGWTLRELDGTVHAFDGAGRWISTTDRNGNAKTGCYDSEPSCDGPGPLIAVDKPDARREEFGYHPSGKLASITEVGVGGAASRTWSFTWSFANSGDRLARFDRPDGTALSFVYGILDRPGYLTRIELIEQPGSELPNRVLRAWEYDAFGNVVRTWAGATDFGDPDAVEKWEFSFDDPALPTITTVTDPLGDLETYTVGREPGSNVTRVEGLSTTCPVCSLSGSVDLDYADPNNELLPTQLTDGEGIVTALTYDQFGQTVSRVDVANNPNADPDFPRETTWQYHPTFPAFPTVIEGPVTMGQPASRRVDLAYDGTNGNLLSRTETGSETTYPTGSFSLVTDYPDYNAAGQVETIDPPGYGTTDRTTFTYDPTRGDLLPLTRQDPLLAAPTQFGYDAFNRRTRVTDPNGVHTETEYDSMGRITRIIQRSDGTTLPDPPVAADLVTTYEYTRYGDLFRVTLPEGNIIEYGYDAAGRLVSIERKQDASTPGERAFYTLDGAGNRIREERQRWTGSAWETFSEKEFVYPTRCRLEQVIEAPGTPEESITDYAYDCNGNAVDVWDGNHDRGTDPATSHYEYDELNRLVEVRQPWTPGGDAVTTYGYDVQDHLTSVLDAEGNLTTYDYSDRDLLTEEISLVSGTTTHTYNDHGELTSSEDAREVTTIRTVDALDRVLDVTFNLAEVEDPPFPGPSIAPAPGDRLLGSASISYGYDVAPASCGAQEDFPIGRPSSITRDGETIEYCYDRFGRLTRDGELTYEYDENANRTTIGYPGGVTATYTYDRANRAFTLTVDDGVNPPQAVASAATYVPFGPLSGLTLGNGLVETRDFDGLDHPAAIAVGSVLDWTYMTDRVGNVLSITDELPGGDPVRSFGYQEPQYFLTGGSGPWGSLTWTYDRIGNRTAETRDAGPADIYDYLQNDCTPPGPPDRPCPGNTALLDTVTLGGGGGRTYTFGPAGHLEAVAAGANLVQFNVGTDGRLLGVARPAAEESAEFEYDGRSFLVRALDFDVTTVVFADGFETGDLGCWSEIVGGVASSGGVGCFSNEARRTRPLYDSHGLLHGLRRRPDRFSPEDTHLVIYFAGRPVAQLELPGGGGSTFTYLTTDHLGTPVLATDGSGAIIWSGGFEPFGVDWQEGSPSGATENGISLRLPGQWEDVLWQDASLGAAFFNNLHRWYERGTGRYTRKDPVGDVESREDLPWYPRFETERFSLYSYVDGNPLAFIDPLGLLKFKGCTPDEQTQITKAFKDYCTKIESPQFKDCMCEAPGIPAGLRSKCDKNDRTVRCRDDRTGECADDPGTYECGWSIPFGRKIRLCPDAWIPAACQPLGCTLMHEMTHQLGHLGESKPDMVEDCLQCD